MCYLMGQDNDDVMFTCVFSSSGRITVMALTRQRDSLYCKETNSVNRNVIKGSNVIP